MVVRMTSQQKKVLALGLGCITGGLLAVPVINRLYANHRAEMNGIEKERTHIWIASGIVGERARKGEYRTLEEANADFELERIRLGFEEKIDG